MRTILLLLLVFSLTDLNGQTDKSTIKEKAQIAATAMLESDWETLIDTTYPKLVQLMGGREGMLTVLTNGQAEFESQGIKFSKVTLGEPQEIYRTGSELFCLVPETIYIQMPNGKLVTESHLLAVSENDGGKWYFIDTNRLTNENVLELLPNFNKELKIPAKKDPQFIPN